MASRVGAHPRPRQGGQMVVDIAPEIPVAASMTDAAADNVIPLDDEIGYCRYSQITGRSR